MCVLADEPISLLSGHRFAPTWLRELSVAAELAAVPCQRLRRSAALFRSRTVSFGHVGVNQTVSRFIAVSICVGRTRSRCRSESGCLIVRAGREGLAGLPLHFKCRLNVSVMGRSFWWRRSPWRAQQEAQASEATRNSVKAGEANGRRKHLRIAGDPI